MKNRKGICIDCPEGSEEKFLISKRCEAHYWKHRKEINSNYKESIKTVKEIVYNKFKLSQIDYEVVPVVKHPKTDILPLHIMSGAKESSIECDIHTTSILKDLVNCFNELESKKELDNHVLNIEGDKLENNN